MTGFATDEARRRVLAAWSDSPHRFREDANAEEDLVLGGYRDRLVVELAQNAADAAARAGVTGRLLLRLDGDTLLAANTGAPLDAAGVDALASLRASAKRDGGTVGRFGVGFAAVLSVSDEPAVVSRTGGVRFSEARTADLVRESGGGLVEELDRRGGQVPVLRLPFDESVPPPEGFATAVLLPLRDGTARDLVRRLLAEVDDTLLLALPALDEISIEDGGRRVLAGVGDRWTVLRRHGDLPDELAGGLPVEDRGRTQWQVTWAVPRNGRPPTDVLHAPTPCDEPLPWPAVLIASVPLEPSRRHVAPGPVTDHVVEQAAAAYAELLAETGGDAWRLVPTGLPAGAIDGALRHALGELLPGTPMLAAADDPEVILRPRDALALTPPIGADEAAVREIASWMAGLVHAPRAADAAFAVLGVRRIDLADVVDQLPDAADPDRWRRLYEVLEPHAVDPVTREALGSIGVPLADGRVVRGARGLLLDSGVDRSAATALGLRLVDPAAAHPLLERLGAVPSGPRALLDLPAVRAALSAALDDDDPVPVSLALLGLAAAAVADGTLRPGDLPWLGDLDLTDEDGDPAPAAALALPGSPAARWYDPDEMGLVAGDLVERWGADVLRAVGVLDGPAPWRGTDVELEGSEVGDVLDGWDRWCEHVLDGIAARTDPLGATVPELLAVRDLDVVLEDALPELVAALAADPLLRPALVQPVRVVAGGATHDVPGHTAWWLRGRLGLAGGVAGPDAGDLRAVLPPAPEWVVRLDPAARRALGVLTVVDDVDAAVLPSLLDALAGPAEVGVAALVRLVRRTAELAAAGATLPEPPQRVRALVADGTAVVDADDAVVADAPMYRQRPDLGAVLPVPGPLAEALADLLDLPLAQDLAPGAVDESDALLQPVGSAVADLLGGVTTVCEHDELRVDGVEVDWWVDDAGRPHAATLDGTARALAWAAGRWDLRYALAELLAAPDPALVTDVAAEQAF